MAYNLQSLITILQQILNPKQTWWIVNQNKAQLESILEKPESLQQLLEKFPLSKVAGSMERRIRDAASRAEDVIESRMVHQMLSAPQGMDRSLVLFSVFTPYLEQVRQQLDLQQDLDRVTQELDIAMQQVVKLMERRKKMMLGGSGPTPYRVQQSVKLVEKKNDLVGFDEELFELKDLLTNMERKMEKIIISGLAGIGKSALARKLYNDPSIISHFDCRCWALISINPIMREVLISLIGGPNGNLSDEVTQFSEDELKEKLYRRLLHRRYMIVLDDVWSAKFFDDIRKCFPDDNNRSRIVITTNAPNIWKRESNTMHFELQPLGLSDSWDLLCQIVFGEEDCPLELKEIGHESVHYCKGIPLVIQVIGGFLSKVERSREVWEHFWTEFRATINVESYDSHWLLINALYWRYNHLPIYLKPCFLYMGALQRANEIKDLDL